MSTVHRPAGSEPIPVNILLALMFDLLPEACGRRLPVFLLRILKAGTIISHQDSSVLHIFAMF